LLLADAVLELLRDEGVERIFGNPGTTELPLIEALARKGELAYTLALHEGPAVAMADGYARAAGAPSFVNLHVAAGVANGLSAMANARRSRVPMVVTAGQQDRRHLDQDPMLAGDSVAIAAPVCKSAVEVHHPPDLPTVLRRAFAVARTPPEGPVFVSIPVDLLGEPLTVDVPPRSPIHPPQVAGGVREAAALLRAAERPALVAGDGIGREDALEEAAAVAEAVGATVYLQPMYDRVPFRVDHPLVAAELPPSNAEIEAILDRHDVVLGVGARLFAPHYYSQRNALPRGTRLLQVDSDPEQVGRNHPVALGMVGGIRQTLAALASALLEGHKAPASQAEPRQAESPRREEAPSGALPLEPREAIQAIVDSLPDRVTVVEEAVTSSRALRAALRPARNGSFHRTAGSALGWGVGAAVGIGFARPGSPVVAVLGDGSAAYGIQALWTAAHESVDAVFVVLNNRQYRAVKTGLARIGADLSTRHPGSELVSPALDWPRLARGFGVEARRAESAAEIDEALRTAAALGGPRLIEVPIAGITASEGRLS
jgi:benzoylformate decarboxylase